MIITQKDKFRTDEKILVECDFKISPKCKNQYLKVYKNVLKGQENNSGKDRCQYCFNSLTKTGSDNFNYKYEKNENYFENIDTELKAYLLGWIAGDGCLKKDGLFFEISMEDKKILELFNKNISPTNKYYTIADEKHKNTVLWKVHSTKIVNDLLKHLELDSYGKKCDVIKLPNLPDNLIWSFVRGLFDSDGCVASPLAQKTSPTSSICSISKQIRSDIMTLCDKNHITYTHDGRAQIIFNGKNCLAFLDKLYTDATYYLTRKYELWEIWKTWKPGLGTSVRPRKIREYYPPISEKHKEKIRESNQKRKRLKYERH